jgi:hypothetical protein
MKNIVVATKENIGYYNFLVESCKRHNIKLIVLGLGKKWEGFTMRYKLYLDYLNTLNNNEIVMINDAYDVVILQDSKIIKTKFLKFNTKILFSGENNYISKIFNKRCIDDYSINNGNIIGYVFYIKKLINLIYKYEKIWEKFNNDDMIIINHICNLESKFFTNYCRIDKKEEIFFLSNGSLPFWRMKNLVMENKKLKNLTYNNYPCVLHLINTDGRKYLEYIGYDLKSYDNISKSLQIYKYVQSTNMVFTSFNVINISLIIIIILFIIIYFHKKLPILHRSVIIK